MNNKRTRGFLFRICLVLGMAASQTVLAQQHLQTPISFGGVEQQRISVILEQVSARGKFSFSYGNDHVPADSIVSLPAFQGSLHDFLVQLFGRQYDFKELSDYVVIRYTPNRLVPAIEIGAASSQELIIAGRITDANTQHGVANVSIYDKHSFASALSDRQGHFKLEIRKPDQTVWVGISKEDYRDTTLVVLMPVEVSNKKRPFIFRYYPGYDGGMPLRQTWFGRFLTDSRQRIQQLNIGGFFAERPYQLSLLPGIGTHGFANSRAVNDVSVNIIGGHAGGVEGVEVSGVFALNELDVSHVQAAGVFNLVGGDMRGVQLAGAINHAVGSLSGVQVAGVYNAAGERVKGMQIAGLVNRAGKVDGVQLAGLVNIADSSDYPIGLVNLVKNGHRSLSIEGDTQGRFRVGFRSGGRVMYGLVGLGYGVARQRLRYLAQAGIGTRLVTGKRFGLDVELVSETGTDFRRSQSQLDVSILPQIALMPQVRLYGGPVLGMVTADKHPIEDRPLWVLDRFNGEKALLFADFTVGLRYVW